MNLYEKLIEVRKEVDYLQKQAKGHQYDYVSSSQVLLNIKKKMDHLGLLLVPCIENAKSQLIVKEQTNKRTLEYFTELTMKYIWINAEKPDERLEVPFYSQGTDSHEKGVGKALTYGEKYFILKSFNIATDAWDPDQVANKLAAKEAEYKANDKLKPVNPVMEPRESAEVKLAAAPKPKEKLPEKKAPEPKKKMSFLEQEKLEKSKGIAEKIKTSKTMEQLNDAVKSILSDRFSKPIYKRLQELYEESKARINKESQELLGKKDDSNEPEPTNKEKKNTKNKTKPVPVTPEGTDYKRMVGDLKKSFPTFYDFYQEAQRTVFDPMSIINKEQKASAEICEGNKYQFLKDLMFFLKHDQENQYATDLMRIVNEQHNSEVDRQEKAMEADLNESAVDIPEEKDQGLNFGE